MWCRGLFHCPLSTPETQPPEIVMPEILQLELAAPAEPAALAVVNSQRESAITQEIVGEVEVITSPVLIDLDPNNQAILKLELKPESQLLAMATNGDEVLTDIETWTHRAAELFVGQAQAREQFFNDLYVYGEWRQLKLQKPELTGAVSHG